MSEDIADGLPNEMTEVEMATMMPLDEITGKNIHFTDPKAKNIALNRCLNRLNKICNNMIDYELEKELKARNKKNILQRIARKLK
jgi:hypothetical protein